MNNAQSGLNLMGVTGDFQVTLDTFLADKYDSAKWKKYAAWGEMSFDKTFTMIEGEKELVPMAALIDSNSPKPLTGLSGISAWSGAIPELGRRTDLTKDDLRKIYMQNRMGDAVEAQMAALGKLDVTTNSLVMGVHTRLNSLLFQAMSTGKIVVSTDNNPDGIAMSMTMPIPDANKLYAGFDKGTSAAWTTDTATPIQDMIDAQNYARFNYIQHDKWIFTPAKWFEFLTHPNVAAVVNERNNIAATSPVFEADVLAYLTLAGIKPIEIVDEMSMVLENNKPKQVSSWVESNIALIPNGDIATVENAMPIEVDDPAAKVAYTEGKRIQVIQTADGSRKVQSIEVECSALPVLNKTKDMIIMDTDRTTAWT